MAKGKKLDHQLPNTGNEPVPPGASAEAHKRPTERGGGPPGSGAGTRHAAGTPGGGDPESGIAEGTEGDSPLLEEREELDQDELEQGQGPPYAGRSGGAVGGTPAEDRSKGGRTHGGIAPGGVHRGDSTIGTDPQSGTE